uniref:Uncharacterized protein n=1 Tax=Tanacetum cinerariifolium TaxID=118510 RepID=A0A6L2JJ91_TANCI|nr:hypothetical protein [Tanacetum cinerariifolium]
MLLLCGWCYIKKFLVESIGSSIRADLLNASAIQSSTADGHVVADGLLLAIESTLTARVDGAIDLTILGFFILSLLVIDALALVSCTLVTASLIEALKPELSNLTKDRSSLGGMKFPVKGGGITCKEAKHDIISIDIALVALENHKAIGKCNMRIDPMMKRQKETRYQVVLDALAISTCYPAFLIMAEVPVIYMHQFWHTFSKHGSSYRFKIDNKKFIMIMEEFRDILNMCPRIEGQEFFDPSYEEEALSFIRHLGHTGEIKDKDDDDEEGTKVASDDDHKEISDDNEGGDDDNVKDDDDSDENVDDDDEMIELDNDEEDINMDERILTLEFHEEEDEEDYDDLYGDLL